MLLLHEVHEVVGAREAEFEAIVRDRWMPALATGDSRLLYFLHHAHGSGASYNVVTITALADGAWEALARRLDRGDLEPIARDLDAHRHDVTARLFVPLPWSPLSEVDLAAVPIDGRTHELSMFMEDTVWPYEERLEEYVERSGSHYAAEMARNAKEDSGTILTIQGGFRTAYGAGRRREILLWQKITQPRALRALLSSEVPDRYKRPGTWMHDALSLRDRWESRLLRTSAWSPWW